MNRIQCPYCGEPHNYRDSSVGNQTRCVACGNRYRLPAVQRATKGGCLTCLGCIGLLTLGGCLLAFVGRGLKSEAPNEITQDSAFKEQEREGQKQDESIHEGEATNQKVERMAIINSTAAPIKRKPVPPNMLNRPNKEDSDWTDATRTVRNGDVQVVIKSVVTDQVGFSDVMLLISLSIENVGKTRKIEYESWSECDTSHIPSITDNFGNTYRRITFGLGTRILSANAAGSRGVVSSTPGRFVRLSGGGWWPPSERSIHPEKSIEEDVLGFELPLENIIYLHLELPASAFGGKGKLRFRIPKDMVNREQKRQAEDKRRQSGARGQIRADKNRKRAEEKRVRAEKERKTEDPAELKRSAEVSAASKLKIAKSLHSASIDAVGQESVRLEREYINALYEIIKKYPMTKAAKEAKELIDKMGR